MLPSPSCALLASSLLLANAHSALAQEHRAPLWNALAVSPDGAWGVGSGMAQGAALTKSLASCQRRSGTGIGCGYQYKVAFGDWMFFVRCGRENIIGVGTDQMKAEQQIRNRLMELREDYGRTVGECLRVAVVSPEGGLEAVQAWGAGPAASLRASTK